MSAFKQFLSQDLIVEPFQVNKGFSFPASEFTDFNVQIGKFLGKNIQSTVFISGSNTPTGNSSVGTQDPELIYNSIKGLYYSNFVTSSYGSPVQTQSLFPGENEMGDVFVGSPDSSGRYENYLQSTVPHRFIPTGSGAEIAVLSIPSRLYGDNLQPNSINLIFSGSAYNITDDGNGNLISGSTVVGNVIYPHGIITFTSPASEGYYYGSSYYGSSYYGGEGVATGIVNDFLTTTDITCSFSSSFDIYETQYKATINEFEFNFSQNPSIISGSTDGTVYDFATGSFFSPYVSTVGLYDDNQNLLAVGKLSQPLPTSRTTDTTIFINIDR